MDKSLLAEVRGRSLKLLAYDFEKRKLKRLNADLVAFQARADREGLSVKQREIQSNAIIDNALDGSLAKLLTETAKDAVAHLKIIQKHLGE